jgi:hypothetical protein
MFMSPLLERGTTVKEADHKKFVRTGNVIAYDDPEFEHAEIARAHGLVKSVSGEKDTPHIDDGGLTDVGYDDKLAFFSYTQSCNVDGDRREQREETRRVAREILGADTVSDH